MAVLLDALLAAHLFFAFLATLTFWVPALTVKGGPTHRAAGRWFARLTYAAAATGGVLAILGLLEPQRMLNGSAADDAAATRHLMWLVLYFLLLIITPVQHGLAVIRAGARPAAVRSRAHATLGLLSIAATILFFPAAVAWQTWSFLLPAPVGFIVGLRNMTYAGRQTASSGEVRREHLTSMITAGIALYTAFFVLSATRWPTFVRSSFGMPFVWLAPTAIGLLAIAWLRRKTSGVFLPRT